MSEQRLRDALQRRKEPIDVQPHSGYELQTRARVEALEARVLELQSRINALVWALITAIVVGVVLDLGGWR